MPETLPYANSAVTVRRLANGLTVLMEPLPYLRSASIGAWIKAGSANETAEQAGISHFLEHLFFKGTTTRTTRQLMEAVESKGGHLNAFTSRDYTCLYAKMLSDHVARGIEILADIVKHSLFNDFEKERNVVLEEIASIEDVPEDHVHDIFTEFIWPNHPLGRPVTGYIETLSAMTVDDVRAYYETWYKPENIILSVAGSFDEDAVLRQLEAEFDPMTSGTVPGLAGPVTCAAGTRIEDSDIGQHHVCFGFPGPGVHDETRYAYNLLSSALGGGSTSRLFDKIREDAGLAYSIYTFNSHHWHSGHMGVYAAIAPENLKQCLDLCAGEIKRICDEPIPEDELSLNREQIKGNMLMGLESTFNRMTRMAKSVMYYGRVVGVDEVITRIDAITADDVQQAARACLTKEQCAMIVLGPSKDAAVEGLPL